jgi:hypothetical protein
MGTVGEIENDTTHSTKSVHIFQGRSLSHFLKKVFKIFIIINGLTKAKICYKTNIFLITLIN